MAGTNGHGEPDPVAEILQPVLDRKAELQAHREHLRAALGEVDGEIKRLDKGLRGFGLLEPEAKKAKAKSPPHTSSSWVSEEMVNRARAALDERFEGKSLTVTSLAEAMGVATATARKCISALTEQQELRFLGNRPTEDGIHKAMTWEAV